MPFSLKSELHCHSFQADNRNIYFPLFTDSAQTVEQIIDRCLSQDIKILSITDHDTFYGTREAQKIISENHLDILLIPGCEITTSEGHVLAYNLQKEVPSHLPIAKTIDLIHEQNAFAIVAHPFMITYTGNRLFKIKPDAIEGLNASVPMFANHKAISAARIMNLPYIAASDAHENQAMANGCTIFPDSVKTVEDVLSCIRNNNFSIKFHHSSYWTMFSEHAKSAINELKSYRSEPQTNPFTLPSEDTNS